MLELDGRDLRHQPIEKRKKLLAELLSGSRDSPVSRHLFSSASAICATGSDATEDTLAGGVDSPQQVLTQPQAGVHIQQVPQPQPPQPPQPLQPQPKQRLKNAHLQCTPTP